MLEELRADCPADLQPAIFDVGWPLVVWHRIVEFQYVSLKMISEALLLQTPHYALAKTLPLAVPGELTRQNLAFAKAVVLWASPANPGAKDVANQLATSYTGLRVCSAGEAPNRPPPLPRGLSSLKSMRRAGLSRNPPSELRPTHMLLYLCEATWSDYLAEQVEAVLRGSRAAQVELTRES